MKREILKLINAFWKFDENEQPISSWNDKMDLLDALNKLIDKTSLNKENRQHCCGLQGFNSMLGDTCPACSHSTVKERVTMKKTGIEHIADIDRLQAEEEQK